MYQRLEFSALRLDGGTLKPLDFILGIPGICFSCAANPVPATADVCVPYSSGSLRKKRSRKA